MKLNNNQLLLIHLLLSQEIDDICYKHKAADKTYSTTVFETSNIITQLCNIADLEAVELKPIVKRHNHVFNNPK